MKSPCDEAVMQSVRLDAPCAASTRRWILLAAILGSSMAFIDSTVVNVALPALQTGLNASVVDVQWVVEAYSLLLGALILVGGSLGDLLGRRKVFLNGVAVFAVASLACGLAGNVQQLIAARAAQGIGAAFLMPGSLALIGASFDDKERGRAIGLWSGFTAITTGLGPVFGGWLIQHASWRWAFFLNLPLAAIVIVISLLHVPESRRPGVDRIDWMGALFATIGLGGVVFGMIESPALGWGHPQVYGSLMVGVLSLAAFFWVEAHTAFPMVPFALFKSKTFSGANLLTFFLYAAIGIFFFLLPLNLIQVQGYSPSQAGAAGLPFIVLMFTLSRWSGGLVTRYGARKPLIIGPLISAAGLAMFALPSVGGSYWTTYFPAYVVLGFGMAITVPPLTTAVMQAVDTGHAGAASGINNAVARVAGLLAIAVFGVVMLAGFRSSLHRSLSKLALPQATLQAIEKDEIKLAALPVPPELDSGTKAEVKTSIDDAFVFGFRLVILICAGLAIMSAIFARILIERPA
ncbi:MAG TPA: MFS transporter [Candidatus Angelobacter sp.]|nr:MFS transporter [Candidatus Angelobacter sp.]